MIDFQWSVSKLLKDEAGIVRVIYGNVTATDDFGNVVSNDIQSPTEQSESDPIPFDQLDEQTVIGWLKDIHEQSLVPLILLELDLMRLDSVEGAELPWGA